MWIFAAGAALGALAAALVVSCREPRPAAVGGDAELEDPSVLSDGWKRIERAWDGTMSGLAAIRDGWLQEEADLEAINELVHQLPGASGLEVHSLAPGILEIIGAAEAEEVAVDALQAVAAQAGVETVVNRIWTGVDGSRARVPGSPAEDPAAN